MTIISLLRYSKWRSLGWKPKIGLIELIKIMTYKQQYNCWRLMVAPWTCGVLYFIIYMQLPLHLTWLCVVFAVSACYEIYKFIIFTLIRLIRCCRFEISNSKFMFTNNGSVEERERVVIVVVVVVAVAVIICENIILMADGWWLMAASLQYLSRMCWLRWRFKNPDSGPPL